MTLTFSYTVVDGNGGSVPQTATITIEGRNDGPAVAGAIVAPGASEGRPGNDNNDRAVERQ